MDNRTVYILLRRWRWSNAVPQEFLRTTSMIVIFLLCCLRCSGFNVDTRTAILHTGPEGSMFGYSVAMHRDKDFSWLLVGAPTAQTEQPGVVNGGGVYRCSTDNPDMCQLIPFDTSGPGKFILRGSKFDMDDKSHQWFGATVHSSGENGAIVACAPRYVYFSSNLQRRDPVGTCWVVRGSFQNFQEYSPCRTTAWGYHRQGSCQAGLSAAVTKDGRHLFIGAVGSWYWQGQLYSQDLLSKQAQHSTPEGPEQDDDSYLGYSMAIGEFTGDRSPDVVLGVPRGSELRGKISLFNSSLYSLHNISGEQMGSYFGYSVCVTDVNSDGLDDIVIGAPLFTDLSAKDGSYEKGRIYVAYQNKKHNFKINTRITGYYSGGRFGLSLAAISDINKDGYNDIAVGSPYGGTDGKGIVLIFHGSSNGIITKASQQISSSDIPSAGKLQTFGFSIDGGMDLDNNQYPDILIGAYDSDKVMFFKSRPVVETTASLKLNPEKINLDEKGCKLNDGTIVTCVVVSFCMKYEGIGVQPSMGFVFKTKLDVESQASRMFFLKQENSSTEIVSVTLQMKSKYCKSTYAYIQNNIRDKLTPISVQLVFTLQDPHPNIVDLKPMLNQNQPNNVTKQINIQKNCGKDNICIPDIKLQVLPNVEQFLIGSVKRLEISVVLINTGEDAFESMLYLNLPVDVDYVNIGKVKPTGIPVSCSVIELEAEDHKMLVCDVGNPLPANTTLMFKIFLAPSKSLSASRDLQFNFLVNSTNTELERTTFDNTAVVNLPVRVEVNITLHGISEPQIIAYNKTEIFPEEKVSETEAGPEVIHIYAVGNKGPSMVLEAEIDILWPTYTLFRRPLLYLMDQPEIQGKGTCEVVHDVNPYLLQKELKKPRSSSYSVSFSKAQEELQEEDEEHSNYDHEWVSNLEKRTKRRIRDEIDDELNCGPTLCTKILCKVFNLTKDEQVIFTIRSRLWKNTLDEMGLDDIQISSKLISRVTSLPHDVDPSFLEFKEFFVTTKVNPETVTQSIHVVPWWILILSVSIGLLLLGLLALVLWQLGFFRRRRVEDQMEEPLHCRQKNGYHMARGDEYL